MMRVVFSSFFLFLVTLLFAMFSHLLPGDHNGINAFHIQTQPLYTFGERMVRENHRPRTKIIRYASPNKIEFYAKNNMKLNPSNFISTRCDNIMQCNVYNRNRAHSTSFFPLFSSKSSETSSNAQTPHVDSEGEKGHGHGHGHGGMMGSGDPNSFVQTELRKEAMRLHTKDQAKEGEQEAQTPFTKWIPERKDYVNFLVDSRHVYRKFEEIVNGKEELTAFRNTGLERAKALDMDLSWFQEMYPDEIKDIPPVGKYGLEYAKLLDEVAERSLPAFMCHFYNHYFAHTAGGRMIGKKMASMLLDSYELNFYQWKDNEIGEEKDVKILLENVRKNMDAMAAEWNESQREECVKETANTFKYGGNLLSYIAKEPSQRN